MSEDIAGKNMKIVRLSMVTFLCMCLFLPIAYAGQQSEYAPFIISGIYLTDQEYLSLPEFLQVKVRYHIGGSPEYSKWNAKMGVDYQHYHHWAGAIVKFHRAVQPENIKKRDFLLNTALDDYGYVLRHCQPENKFRYIFHLRRGQIYYIKGDYAAAGDELRMSLKHKNDFSQTYVVLSNVYDALGMKEQAQEARKKAEQLKSDN